MRRRIALLAPLLCLLQTQAGRAHTPFQQWVVYRRKHLIIGTSKADAGSYDLGKKLVAQLEVQLPESKARTARAPNAHDWEKAAPFTATDLWKTEYVLHMFKKH